MYVTSLLFSNFYWQNTYHDSYYKSLQTHRKIDRRLQWRTTFLKVNKYTMSTIPHNTDYSEFMFLFFPHVRRPLKYDMYNECWTRNMYTFTITHMLLGIDPFPHIRLIITIIIWWFFFDMNVQVERK
jgi:hypothetical protein